MINPNPKCEKECSFSFYGGMSTCMAYYPTYDKHGNETSKDPNTHTSNVRCNTCNREWHIARCRGETTITEEK